MFGVALVYSAVQYLRRDRVSSEHSGDRLIRVRLRARVRPVTSFGDGDLQIRDCMAVGRRVLCW